MDYQTILYEKSEAIATITLNRPQSMNALNSRVFAELVHVLSEIEGDDEVKVAILAGSEKFFAAGADITEIGKIATPVEAHR
jgi:enoyl-CoA hydratase